tara:strand:- start:103 stop:618 length:516 start_codon:yes stop_codon:yes gene_type:complete
MDLSEFVDVIGYEGLYKINKDGDVYGIKNKKKLKQQLEKGYFRISLSKNNQKKTHKIHRLVALHFITNDDETKNQVDHIDGVRTNNNIYNLRWVTPVDNARNVVSNSNYIYELIRKDRKNNRITFTAYYPIYIDGKLKRIQKWSIHRNIVEEWVEKMKIEYPNPYNGGRIC